MCTNSVFLNFDLVGAVLLNGNHREIFPKTIPPATHTKQTDMYFNLALTEYFLQNTELAFSNRTARFNDRLFF
jgi:hypothetical protein